MRNNIEHATTSDDVYQLIGLISWLLQHGYVDIINDMLKRYNPDTHSINFCVTILRMTYRVRHLFTEWDNMVIRMYCTYGLKKILHGLYTHIDEKHLKTVDSV